MSKTLQKKETKISPKWSNMGPRTPPPRGTPNRAKPAPETHPRATWSQEASRTPPGPPFGVDFAARCPLPEPPGTPKSSIWEPFWKPKSLLLEPFPVRTSIPNRSTLGALLQSRSWPPRCAAAVLREACSIRRSTSLAVLPGVSDVAIASRSR